MILFIYIIYYMPQPCPFFQRKGLNGRRRISILIEEKDYSLSSEEGVEVRFLINSSSAR